MREDGFWGEVEKREGGRRRRRRKRRRRRRRKGLTAKIFMMDGLIGTRCDEVG